jgi:hypothetical protein
MPEPAAATATNLFLAHEQAPEHAAAKINRLLTQNAGLTPAECFVVCLRAAAKFLAQYDKNEWKDIIFAPIDVYSGFIGPTSFGIGDLGFLSGLPSSGSGDMVGIAGGLDPSINVLEVPDGYVSNSALSNSSTWLNDTFSSLGVTPGTYEWTWGPGPNQNFTLIIGATAIPEPASAALLGAALAGLLLTGARRRRISTCQ